MPVTASRLMRWSLDHNNCAIDEVLEDLDNDIRSFANRKVPRNIVPVGISDIEENELAQDIRIKVWLALQREHILNPKAYARRIAHTESIDRIRKYKKIIMSINDYDSLDQGEIIAAPSQGMQDPADEYEQQETIATYIEIIARGVLLLPPRQQYAMLCNLKDSAADFPPLMDTLLKYGMNLETVHWPEDKDELPRLRVSGSIARRKLRAHLKTENRHKVVLPEIDSTT